MISSAMFADALDCAGLLDRLDLVVDQPFHRFEPLPLRLDHFLRHGELRLVEARQVGGRRIEYRPGATTEKPGELTEVLKTPAKWIGRRIGDDVRHSAEGRFQFVDACEKILNS